MSPRRIGLLGGESTGKTTLAMALAEELPGFVAEEYLRDFVRDFGRIPTPADQEGIYLAQQMAVNRAMIADPLPLMTAVYSVAYFDVDSLLAGGIADASTYDVLLWCAPDFPWRADLGQRDGPAYRLRVEDVIAHRVAPRLPLHQVSGTPPERLEQALLLCTEASADP
ncbi:MAG: ATP-binding protein [Candidatus Nanopelagicales bacterium]